MFYFEPSKETMPAHFWYQLNGKSAMENYMEQKNDMYKYGFVDPFFAQTQTALSSRRAAAEEEPEEEEESYEIQLKTEVKIK